jgi:hypothetical protein
MCMSCYCYNDDFWKRRSRFTYFLLFLFLFSILSTYYAFSFSTLFIKKHSRSCYCFFFLLGPQSTGRQRQVNERSLAFTILSLSLHLSRIQISFFSFFFCSTSNNQWVTKSFAIIKKKLYYSSHYYRLMLTMIVIIWKCKKTLNYWKDFLFTSLIIF